MKLKLIIVGAVSGMLIIGAGSTNAEVLGCGCINDDNFLAAEAECSAWGGEFYHGGRVRAAKAGDPLFQSDYANYQENFFACTQYINLTPVCITSLPDAQSTLPTEAMVCESIGARR